MGGANPELPTAPRMGAFHPSMSSGACSLFISILLQSHRKLLKMKNEIGGFCVYEGSV